MDPNRREFIVTSSLAVAAGALVPGGCSVSRRRRRRRSRRVPMFASLRRNVGTFTARGGTIGWLVPPMPSSSSTVSSPTRRRCFSTASSR